MLIVRGVNVWPSAIKDVVMTFRPEATGEMIILLDAAGPKVDPPLNIRVEAVAGEDATLADRIERELRAKLIFAAKVELVPAGTLPRTEMKAKLTSFKNA